MDPNPPATSTPISSPERWAHLRFSVVGPLLASPPIRGQLRARLRALADQAWRHPTSGQWMHFGVSTIERWYYRALRAKQDPVGVLRRQVRADAGTFPALPAALGEKLVTQYRAHPQWSYQLHADNLAAVATKEPALGSCPGYACVRRFLKARGLFPRPRRGPVHSPGAQAAEARFAAREIRSYQSEQVNALWHLDFHHGKVRVLLADGQWGYPLLLGVLDDRSRLCCHLQWYLHEGAEELCHGLAQALLKRSLPRALMTDNGAAMLAHEITQGLARLGIVHETTLPFSPYQNGKQEKFWSQIEGRLLPMLEGVADLSLRQLNEATQAWVEMEYNRKEHSELGQSPLAAYQQAPDVGRPAPDAAAVALRFTAELVRTQRRSDGTLSVAGVRFEVPSRYGHLERLHLRVASWDLSQVHLVDPKTGVVLGRLYPLDKHRNAAGRRAARVTPADATPIPPTGVAPLLAQLIAQYAATGLPPAYLPKTQREVQP
ncbi:MAG: DDE-type integrase/transposase/recombinase [Rhodospirillales bacterium]|nr:DDE-type integrase/transposase/recombinase [Rhodospirillales bacterium]